MQGVHVTYINSLENYLRLSSVSEAIDRSNAAAIATVHSDKVATQVDCDAICLSDAICKLWLAAGNINKVTPNPCALISCLYLNSEVVEQIDSQPAFIIIMIMKLVSVKFSEVSRRTRPSGPVAVWMRHKRTSYGEVQPPPQAIYCLRYTEATRPLQRNPRDRRTSGTGSIRPSSCGCGAYTALQPACGA